MTHEFIWLAQRSREIYEKYAGLWIAVFNCEVVGVGSTATEAANQAERKFPGADYLLEKVERDVDAIYGGRERTCGSSRISARINPRGARQGQRHSVRSRD